MTFSLAPHLYSNTLARRLRATLQENGLVYDVYDKGLRIGVIKESLSGWYFQSDDTIYDSIECRHTQHPQTTLQMI